MVESKLKSRVEDNRRADFKLVDCDSFKFVVTDEDVAEKRSHGKIKCRFLKLAERVPTMEVVAQEVKPVDGVVELAAVGDNDYSSRIADKRVSG